MSSLSASGARRRLRSTGAAAKQLHPPCTGEGVEAERHKSQRDDSDEQMAVWLAQEEQESSAEAGGLARVMMNSSLDQEKSDDQERDATGGHPEAAEPDRDVSFGLAHLARLQVVLEGGPVGLDELADADSDRDDAQQNGDDAACRIGQQSADSFLGAVVGG